MIKPGSQNDQILSYMKANEGITTMDAFLEIGCTRLASRICELKKEGYCIGKRQVEVKNRYGKPLMVTEYSLCS